MRCIKNHGKEGNFMPFTFNFGGFNPGGYQTGGQGAQPDFTQRPQKERKPRRLFPAPAGA